MFEWDYKEENGVIEHNYDCVNSKPLILKHRRAETKFRKVEKKDR